MPTDLQGIRASKDAYRAQLASRPIGEKFRMLDAMREREIAIRGRDHRPNGVGRSADPIHPSGGDALRV